MSGAVKEPLLTRLAYYRHINLFALLAGLITLYLVLRSGELVILVSNIVEGDTITIGLGEMEINVLGRSLSIPILDYLVISSKLSYLVASLSLITGSLVKDEELSKGLIGFKLPSMTGLILTLVALILMYLGGSFNPLSNEVSMALTINIGGRIYSIPISYSIKPTLNTYLALTANLMAILGRLAVRGKTNYIRRLRELSTSIFIPI